MSHAEGDLGLSARRRGWTARAGRRDILAGYRREALARDAVAALAAGALAWTVRPASFSPLVAVAGSVLLPAAWVGLLAGQRAYESRFLGTGSEEYRRVVRASLMLLVATVVSAFLSHAELSRGFMLAAFSTLLVLTLAGRQGLRSRLNRRRRGGEAMHRVVVVGQADAVRQVVSRLDRAPAQGLLAVGACVPGGTSNPQALTLGVPVLGSLDSVPETVREIAADTVAVVSDPDLSGQALRRLAWALEEESVDLLVVPGIVEMAAPRLSIRPIAGLSLLHLQRPTVRAGHLALKVTFDRIVALLVLAVAAPLLAGLYVGCWATGRRPALRRSARIGRAGGTFEMLTGTVTGGGGRLGVLARRLHLHEAPLLVNVLRGELSLVGPRAADDVADGAAPSSAPESDSRLLRVRPGLTGPWRLAEPDRPTAEELLSMDLRYVDNWSMTLDVLILCRSVRALAAGSLPGVATRPSAREQLVESGPRLTRVTV